MYRYQLNPHLLRRPLDQEVAIFNRSTDSLHLVTPFFLQQLSELSQHTWDSQDMAVQFLLRQEGLEALSIDEVRGIFDELIRLELVVTDVGS